MRIVTTTLGGALLAALLGAGAGAQTPPPGAPHPAPALGLMSAAVPCSDLERSIDFYTRGLGLKALARLENPSATEVVLAFPGGGANLMLLKPKDPSAALPVRGSLDRIVVAAPDLKALQAMLSAAGYALKGPLHEEARYHVVVANAEDPDGNVIELVQHGP